jgi:CheY-like chemotaxis protein
MNLARILCLDDEPVGLAIRATVLQRAGYTVCAASSAEEALQILTARHIDLVISDHLLRGTTGTRVAEAMKQIKPEIAVLILSGLTEAPEGMEFADFFLCKLEPPPVFLATVANLLASTRSGGHKVAPSRV